LQTNLPRRTSTLRDPTLSTLSHLDAKYNSASGPGKQQQHATKKVKVFDDDLSEDEDEERIFAGEDGLDGSGSEDEDEGDDDEESGDEDEDDDEDEEDDEEEDDDKSENNDSHPITRHPLPAKTNTTTAATANGNGTAKLDPVAAIRASKNKEVEKGRAILRQQVRLRSLMLLSLTVLPRSLKRSPRC
jgi:protein AATF/BFR2